MVNLFYNLPSELQSYIYEFDTTYRDIFKQILKEIKRYRVFRFVVDETIYTMDSAGRGEWVAAPNIDNFGYFVFDKWTTTYWKTNSLAQPHWIICYHYPPLDFLQDKIEMGIVEEIEYEGQGFVIPYEDLVDAQHHRQVGGEMAVI